MISCSHLLLARFLHRALVLDPLVDPLRVPERKESDAVLVVIAAEELLEVRLERVGDSRADDRLQRVRLQSKQGG